MLSHTASDTSIALRCIDEELYSLTLTLLWGEGMSKEDFVDVVKIQ